MESLNTVQTVRAFSRNIVRELDVIKGVFQDTGLTYSECHTLFELEQHKLLNLAEIAAIIQLDKSTTSRVVKSLVKKGLVAISKNSVDQRQKLFSLTEQGTQATHHNNCLANDQVKKALSLLNPSEVDTVLSGLKLYSKALSRSRKQSRFQIRPIEQQDNPKVARLIREVMTEYQAVGEGYSIMDPEVDQMYEAYHNDQSAFFVITQNEENILGCGGIGPLTGADGTCELKKMYFSPDLRGMGFGKKLVQLCLDAAKERAYKKCYLETIDRMWQANLLYQKMGFTKLSCPMGNTGHGACEAYYVMEL